MGFKIKEFIIIDYSTTKTNYECHATTPYGFSPLTRVTNFKHRYLSNREEWKKLDRKAKSKIRLCVSDSVLLNVSREATTKALWDKLGTLYQSKSLVKKLFLRKKLYNLRMKDGDSVTEHLNAFNTMVSQLSYVEIKIADEDKCISLLCSLPDLWDSLVIAIGSNATALQFDEIVSALLTEEIYKSRSI